MTTSPIRVGSWTPWGAADDVEYPIPGLAWLGTPSHGGMHLVPDLNAKVPAPLRKSDGWYEEDCEANIPVAVFPQAFPRANQVEVHDQLHYWFTEKHAAAYPEEAAARAGARTSADAFVELAARRAAQS